jgi:hypothetical protein
MDCLIVRYFGFLNDHKFLIPPHFGSSLEREAMGV